MEDQRCSRELQLPTRSSSPFHHHQTALTSLMKWQSPFSAPSLDLKLSLDVETPSSNDEPKAKVSRIQAMKRHTAEQTRLAAVEEAYTDQVRELTKREMEIAEEEIAQARLIWERAQEQMETAERMKEMATWKISSTSAEITCRACRQKFRP